MKKTSLRVTVCLVLFVLILDFFSSVKTVSLGENAFPRQMRRPPCAFARCTNGGNSRMRASAAMKRVFTKVRN